MVIPQVPAVVGIDLDRIQGADAVIQVEAMIAERAARQAEAASQCATRRAPEMMPQAAVPRYWLRLFGLFLLEFPVLTMAFVPVAEVSPIVAAGSAAALALFLVLGAHALGVPLRSLGDRLPAVWRNGIAVALMAAFLGAVVWIILELRIEGLAHDAQGSAPIGSVFGAEPPPTPQRDFATVIAIAAALVTLGTLLFGIIWSYQRHSPEVDLVRAEAVYRDRLRRLARTRAKMAGRNGRMLSSVLVALLAFGVVSKASRAADCPGSTVVALLDATTAYDDIDRAAIIPAIEAMAASLQDGQRLIVRTVSDTIANSRILLDVCVPVAPGVEWSLGSIWTWLTSSPTRAMAERRAFRTNLRDATMPLLHGRADTDRTALIETILKVSIATKRFASLWLFSDLLESELVDPSDLIAGQPTILPKAAPRLPHLIDVDVHVAGMGRFHDKQRRNLMFGEQQALLGSWRLLVSQAGGTLEIIQ